MNTKLNESLATLEALIDKYTLPQIVAQLADICREKSQHLRENWQDEKSAKVWDKNATKLEKCYPLLYS